MKLSQKLADFNTEVNASMPYINSKAAHLKEDSGQVTQGDNFLSDWNIKYPLYVSPATHTEQSVFDINELYSHFHPFIAGVKQQIKLNKAVTLTGADISTLHIHVDAAHRGHVPRPAFAPANSVIKSTHLVAKIFTNNPNPPHEKETAMPQDVAKIDRKLAVVGSADPAPKPEQYDALETVGYTIYDLVFAPEQEGARAYLITNYENARGEQGPPSVALSFIIS